MCKSEGDGKDCGGSEMRRRPTSDCVLIRLRTFEESFLFVSLTRSLTHSPQRVAIFISIKLRHTVARSRIYV